MSPWQTRHTNTCVLALTAFRDELGEQIWKQLEQSPVRTTWSLLFDEGDQPTLACPPWGRTFQDHNGKITKLDPFSFQVHCRIDQTDLKKMLRASGRKGVYTTPKTEDKRISQQYQIIWLNLDLLKITVSASSMDCSLGIVRHARQTSKISRGIRFDRADFPAAFQNLKPGEDMPSQIACKHLFKIAPVPIGAKHAEVQAWLTSNGWDARPLQALTGSTWLCGTADVFEADFAQWNQQTILLKWIQQKASHQPWLLAGSTAQFQTVSKTQSSASKDLPPLTLDPWNNYQPIHMAAKPNAALPPAVTRKLEAPIEDRFASQQKDFEKLREDTTKQLAEMCDKMNDVGSQIQDSNTKMIAYQKNVESEFKQIKAETQKQFHDMNQAFSSTLDAALTKQDKSISSQLTELKLLLTGKPNACKKARVAKLGESDAVEIDEDDKNL